MPAEESKAIARRFVDEVMNSHDLSKADAIVAQNCVMTFAGLPEPLRGLEAMKQLGNAYLAAFPDMQMTVHEYIGEGDLVSGRFTVRGTHRGELMGLPATGKAATWSGMGIWRVRDGKVVEHWVEQDTMGLMQQLGAIPVPQQAPA